MKIWKRCRVGDNYSSEIRIYRNSDSVPQEEDEEDEEDGPPENTASEGRVDVEEKTKPPLLGKRRNSLTRA